VTRIAKASEGDREYEYNGEARVLDFESRGSVSSRKEKSGGRVGDGRPSVFLAGLVVDGDQDRMPQPRPRPPPRLRTRGPRQPPRPRSRPPKYS